MVFRAGDEPDFAYRIQDGCVEVVVEGPEGPRVLTEMGEGEIFGEMALIIDKPRPASIRARTPVTVEVLDEETFESQILDNHEQLCGYLGRLFERLRTTSFAQSGMSGGTMEAIEDSGAKAAADIGQAENLVLEAVNEIPGSTNRVEIPLDALPFNMGRQTGTRLLVQNQFTIFDRKPYRVSRGHCVIERLEGKIAVRDRCSTTGTIVNGEVLGEHGQRSGAFLHEGENELILGPPDSDFRFRLIVG